MAKSAPKRTAAPAARDGEHLSGWQQRALDRSLVDAKRRALDKSNGFVKAAKQLLDETGGLNFTVQDVVDRSKLSLRSFYQTFASKDDLLLALFEEYVASAAAWQRDQMAEHDDPIEQIRVFLTSLWANMLSPEVVRTLAHYTMILSTTRPAELRARVGAATAGARRRGRARHRRRRGAPRHREPPARRDPPAHGQRRGADDHPAHGERVTRRRLGVLLRRAARAGMTGPEPAARLALVPRA